MSEKTTLSKALKKKEIEKIKNVEDDDLNSVDHKNGMIQRIKIQKKKKTYQ